MLLKREGLPEEKEFVVCKVTSVQYHCVNVVLEEYGNLEGMIHISEVSPGRIRNINDFVRVGRTIVCMVLKISREYNRIDLSLRRVTDNQKRNKMNQLKRELFAEKIVEAYAEEQKIPVKKLYQQIIAKVFKDYDYLIHLFEDVVEGEAQLDKYVDKKVAEGLLPLVLQRIKPKEVEISGLLSAENYEPDGVDIIRLALVKAEKIDKNVNIKYSGAGKYTIMIKAKEYKIAEDIMKQVLATVEAPIKKINGVIKFDRIETKK